MACTTVQNFCSDCQTVSEHSTDIFGKSKFSFSQSSVSKNKAMALFINEAIDALQKIHDYGKEGTAKPSQAELDTLSKVASKQKISHLNYNQLLSVLNVSGKNVSSKQRLYGSYFYDLETYINNYKLDESRCDSCNSSCQSGQSCNQGCGEPCEISCQTNCEGGICGCQIGCEGICALGAQCADCKALM